MDWFNKKKRIYMDYAAATPILPEVKAVMEKYFSESFHNPSAIYEEGVAVKKEMEDARSRVARLLEATPKSIVFTASGTESDNLVIFGAFEAFKRAEVRKPHLIISSIEHPAVMSAAEEVKARGGEVSVVEVGEDGLVSPEAIKKLIKKNTFLISIGLGNSEIGTVQPIAKIGRLIREYRKENKSAYPYLHTDASQAANFFNIGLEHLQVDLLTLDGSKIYGPKGVGVLALKPSVKIHPIIFGGDQEGGRRAGTLNTALVAGFAAALEIALRDREAETKRLETFRKFFVENVLKNAPGVVINGSPESHLPNIVSVSVPGALSELILLKLDKEGVLASVGTACSLDGKVSGSPVIRAIGKPELAEATLRFSFGRQTTPDEIRKTTQIFCRVASSVVK